MKRFLLSLLLVACACFALRAAPTPVIVSTDFNTDVGDLGGVSLACVLHRQGYWSIKAIVIDSDDAKAPGAVAAVLKYWQVTGVSLGCYKGAGLAAHGSPESRVWMQYLYDNYPRNPDGTTVGLASTVADSTVVLRTTLAAQTEPVTIVTLGFLTCMSDLLDSGADGISGLTGTQLVSAKVRDIWITAGDWPNSGSAEWNLLYAPAAAHNVALNWPTPVTWVGIVGGDYVVGAVHAAKTAGDLMREGYAQAGASGGRFAWDDAGIEATWTRGAGYSIVRGTGTVNASTGQNTWTSSLNGNHRYLVQTMPDSVPQTRINTMVTPLPTASPLIANWGSASPVVQLRF